MKSGIIITCAVLIGTALLVPVEVQADTVTLTPTRDNTLYEPVSQVGFADTSNALGPNMFTGKVKDALNQAGQVAVRRAVVHFDIAGAIPPGATINAVQLTLVATKVKQSNAFDVALHRLLSDWGEGTSNTGNSQQGRGDTPTTNDPTWNHTFYASQFWSAAGGDYSGTISASTPVGNTGTYLWGSSSGMVADVQLWLDDSSQNFGWIVIGDESQIETAKSFATVNNTNNGGADRPSLLVDYTPTGGPTGACCEGDACTIVAGIGACPGVYQGDGTNCTPNPCTGPLTGACCATDGTCAEQTQTDCEAVAGNVYQGDGSTCATVECPIALTPYVDALPLPPIATPDTGSPGATAEYTLTMVEFEQQAHSELPGPTRVWGYTDGVAAPQTPGPIIVARTGMPVTVNWVNDIRDLDTNIPRTDNHYLDVDVQDDGMGNVCIHGAEDAAKTVVHLHGGHVPAAVDGYPEDTFLPGDPAATYVYPNDQQAGYLWFHDHALGITRLNVYMGLAGAYLVRDAVEDAINIPGGEFEVPLVLQDRKFNPDGSYNYPSQWQDMWFGDKVMVNGKVWPFFNVRQGKYRFKLLGGSGSRVYTLSLSPPSGLLSFTVIGNEGGLLEAPVNGVGQLTIGPGERYDVVVDFSAYNAGDEILLQNSAGAPFPNGANDVTQVMKFVVTSQIGHTDPLPATLRPIERIDPAEAVISRDFRLKRSGTDACGRSIWEINNLHWDDITEYPELGTTEIWRFINDSGVSHPMHMHLVFFQILDRDGFTTGAGGEVIPDGNPQPPLVEESGWKDTAMVGPNEILRVIARFEDYKGKYAYHCHILEHEDHEMMRQFQTVLCGDAEIDLPVEGCDDGGRSDFDGCSSACEVEEYVELSGIGNGQGGGRVDLMVNGELIGASDTTGLTAAEVVQLLATEINNNVNLQALGITATAVGNRLVTTGVIETVDIRDAGLTDVLELEVRRTQLWWGNVEAATNGYDVVSGSLDDLRAVGDFALAAQTCEGNDQTATFIDIAAAVPPAGDGTWYLLRSQPGSYDSGGDGQAAPRDAGLTACP